MIRELIFNAGRVLIVVAAVLLPLIAGFGWFVANLPPATADPSATDAIVVLTGGSERISTGIALLEAGKGKRLFVSGVNARVEVADLLKIARPEAAASARSADLAARIDVGHVAGDTYGNAAETADWMHEHQFRTMRLVTSDYHMRRALIEFRLAAPDLEILPNPVRPPNLHSDRWWRDRNARDLMLSEYGKYVIARWRYTLARLTGTD
jgi:uncharacterized SAM-binding protein YcdF (DUF218 family)